MKVFSVFFALVFTVALAGTAGSAFAGDKAECASKKAESAACGTGKCESCAECDAEDCAAKDCDGEDCSKCEGKDEKAGCDGHADGGCERCAAKHDKEKKR